MDPFVHTLTAYHLVFSYMKRNNPLREELNEKIQNDEKPDVNIEELLNEFIFLTKESRFDILTNNRKVALLDLINDIEIVRNGSERYYVIVRAGITNVPIKMVNIRSKDKKAYDFNNDWVSTSPHRIFIYSINGEYYMVCHRNGGSGCKTVLNSVLNNILRKKGIKLEMNWLPPLVDNSNLKYDIEKLTLICEEEKSSDIADELNKKKKHIAFKELTLNLGDGRFPFIRNVLNKYQVKEISREQAMDEIKKSVNDLSYNNASVVVRFGQVKKKVCWNDLEGLFDGFDITDKVRGLKGNDFVNTLKETSDDFLFSLINGR